jgi:hypothetical protein
MESLSVEWSHLDTIYTKNQISSKSAAFDGSSAMEKWLLFEKTMWWTQQKNPCPTSNLHHDIIAMTYQWSQMTSLDVAMMWHHTGMRLSGSWRHVRQALRFRVTNTQKKPLLLRIIYSDIAEWLPWIGKCLRGENYRHHWSGFGGNTENHKNPVSVLIYRWVELDPWQCQPSLMLIWVLGIYVIALVFSARRYCRRSRVRAPVWPGTFLRKILI